MWRTQLPSVMQIASQKQGCFLFAAKTNAETKLKK